MKVFFVFVGVTASVLAAVIASDWTPAKDHCSDKITLRLSFYLSVSHVFCIRVQRLGERIC